MGFESFRVELRGGQTEFAQADRIVRGLPHVRLDPEGSLTPNSSCYLRDDGQHIVEIELQDAPVRVSCRFTLCHPSTVDSVFLAFVRELMDRLGMEAKVCDDVAPEHSGFSSCSRFAEFAEVAEGCIAARRSEWVAAFGSVPLAATTNEVHRRVIFPQCQPGIKEPTLT